MKISAESALRTIERGFLAEKISSSAARATAEALVKASLFGIDSHGIRLFGHYVEEIRTGRIRFDSIPSYTSRGATVNCDANWSLSHFAARMLLEKLAKMSREHGISIGTIVKSDHIGALGVHAVNAGLQDLIVLGFTNANALALDPTGRQAVFGTNPISLVTGEGENLIYVDLSTTQFTMNRVKKYAEEGMSLPLGVARDARYKPTEKPNEANYLEPLGGHKGYALAYLVEVLTSGLSASPHSSTIPDMYLAKNDEVRSLSHTFVVIDPTFFGLTGRIKNLAIGTIQSLLPELVGDLPGRREAQSMRDRLRDGIPVSPAVIANWKSLGIQLD